MSNPLSRISAVAILLAAVAPAGTPQCQAVRVAAASDLRFVMPQLVAEFAQSSQNKAIDVSYGSSGTLFAQIRNGAPFDLFFSADVEHARKLADTRLAEPATLYEYATGRIVLWAPRESALDAKASPWQILASPAIRRLAIANPQDAPYGRAAVTALRAAGVYEQVKNRLVYGENISQAAQFVQSKNAEAGILALSLAISPALADGKRWEIPDQMYPPIRQAVIRLNSRCYPERANAFLHFIKSDQAQVLLEKFGFRLPAKE